MSPPEDALPNVPSHRQQTSSCALLFQLLFYVSKLHKVYWGILGVICEVCAQVRMSPDNMTAFVLWDAHDDHYQSASREVAQRFVRTPSPCSQHPVRTPSAIVGAWKSRQAHKRLALKLPEVIIMQAGGGSALPQQLLSTPSKPKRVCLRTVPAAAGHGAPSGHACAAKCASPIISGAS